jgi:arabinose-5-phosphate isomerase
MLERIRAILEAEATAISSIPIDHAVEEAVKLIAACEGKLFTTGIGKAGYVAHKAASTFSTTGSPSVFLHPGDAAHGDVGAVRAGDILIAYSNSGSTREILETAHFCRHLGVSKIICITGGTDSPLANESDIVLNLGKIIEPCPLGFTPTASAAAMLALSDALALTAMELRGFTKEDFALRHHGGYLGKKSRE